jgi:hypothetical protein
MRRACGAAVVACLLFSLLMPAAAPAATTLADRAVSLGLTCAPATTADGPSYTRCDGELPSFDGIGLRTTIGFPEDATDALPTVGLFHGWLLGGRMEFVTSYLDARDRGHFAYHWNIPWFATRGFVSVAYTTRGVAASCGLADRDPRCVNGYLHLAQRQFEVRDAQHIFGTLVDAGIADSDSLVATGGSLGGGISWLLATSFPWDTPAPGTRTIRLASAVPQVGWTDLLAALVPNGRATDDPVQPDLSKPFGVPKLSTAGGLLAIGRVDPGIPIQFVLDQAARFNEWNSAELHSFLSGQLAIANAGEPYDVNPATSMLVDAYRDKSAYYANDWLEALAAGDVEPVPILAVSGWMDSLFPAVETLQMYRRLLAAKADYPIELAFGGFAHKGNEGRHADWAAINDAGNAFIDAVIGRSVGPARPVVTSFVAQCSPGAPGPYVADSWDALAPVRLVFQSSEEQETTSAAVDAEDVRRDPILGPIAGDDPICKIEPRARASDATWDWDVPSEGFTMAGLARVTVEYSLQGIDATVIAKLYDVGPGDTRTLADRGVYRLATAGGDAAEGTLEFKLFGTSWNFQAGHTLQLELSQTDGVFLRPDDLASRITWHDLALTLPTVPSEATLGG